MNLISLFCVCIYLLLANLTTVIICNKTFGKCLPLTMMMQAFTLYLSQMIFKTFNIGFYLSIIYALISVIYIIKNRNNKIVLKNIHNNYITNSFYFFIIVLIFFSIFDFNRVYTHWDEFSHWGEMLKEMIRTDKFYSSSLSVLQVHKDYPPIIQLFELFIIKLFGSYKECYAIFALHLLELSLFTFLIDDSIKLDKKNLIIGTFFTILLIFLSIILFDLHGIVNSIYIDYFLAFLVAYILITIFLSKDKTSIFTLLNISISSSFLLLTKQIGISLYAMIIFFYFICLIMDNKKIKISKGNIIVLLKIVFLIIVVPILLLLWWNSYIKTLNIDSQFNVSDIKMSELYNIYKGNSGTEEQRTTAINFINALKDYNLTVSYIKLSYFQAIILGLFLIYLLAKKSKKVFDSKRINLLIITLALGSLGYAFVMLTTYVFCFNGVEALELYSFDRYMSTYILIVVLSYIMLLIYLCYKKNVVKYIIYLTIILSLIVPTSKFYNLIPKLNKNSKNIYEENAEIIRKNVKGNKKVFILAQSTSGDYQFSIKYYANPIVTNLNNYNWPNDNTKEYYKSIKKDITKYDYIYIANVNDNFNTNYKFVFNNDIQNGQLYRISKESDNKYKLILVK